MATKLCEHTYGTHTYMRLRLDSGRIEEIDVYYRGDHIAYRTTADRSADDPNGLRREIIAAFNELF